MADQARHLGYGVVGPASSIGRARRLARVKRLEGASPDSSLPGNLAEAIGRAPRRRNIPFPAIDGYDKSPNIGYGEFALLPAVSRGRTACAIASLPRTRKPELSTVSFVK